MVGDGRKKRGRTVEKEGASAKRMKEREGEAPERVAGK